MNERVLVTVDRRHRISLLRITEQPHQYYLAHKEPDGTIILVPSVVVAAEREKVAA